MLEASVAVIVIATSPSVRDERGVPTMRRGAADSSRRPVVDASL